MGVGNTRRTETTTTGTRAAGDATKASTASKPAEARGAVAIQQTAELMNPVELKKSDTIVKPAELLKAASVASGGASTAATTYAQARPAPGHTMPTHLARPTRSPESMVFGQVSPDNRKADGNSYPVKPQAEASLRDVTSDPKFAANPNARPELGKLVNSETFRKLDAEGQAAALELFQKNLGDPAGPGRAREAVESLRSFASEPAAKDALFALRMGSPLSADTVEKTKALYGSRAFADLSPAHKQLVATGVSQALGDPQHLESIKGLLEDPRFKGLKAGQQTLILKQISQVAGASTVELFRANLGDKDALGRVHTVLSSLGDLKTVPSRLAVSEALRRSSPLTHEMFVKTEALLSSSAFKALEPLDQQAVLERFRDGAPDIKVVDELTKLVEDPKLQDLTPESRSHVLQGLAALDKTPTAAQIAEIQRLMNGSEADRREALIKTCQYYGIDISKVESLRYDPSLEGRAAWTSKEGEIVVGPGAFKSPGYLASALAHEAEIHLKQLKKGGWYRGPQGRNVQEVQALDHQIDNAKRYGLSYDEVEDLKSKRQTYYDDLSPEYKQRVDRKIYDMVPGEEDH